MSPDARRSAVQGRSAGQPPAKRSTGPTVQNQEWRVVHRLAYWQPTTSDRTKTYQTFAAAKWRVAKLEHKHGDALTARIEVRSVVGPWQVVA